MKKSSPSGAIRLDRINGYSAEKMKRLHAEGHFVYRRGFKMSAATKKKMSAAAELREASKDANQRAQDAARKRTLLKKLWSDPAWRERMLAKRERRV
jgi:hypothetical protein